MGVLLSHSLYLPQRVLLTWATPGPGFLTLNVIVGHKIIIITITKLFEATMNLLSEKFQHSLSGRNQHFPIFLCTTPLSITIQDRMPGTVLTGFLPGFHSPCSGSFRA